MSSVFCDINEEHASENVKKVPGAVYLCQTEYMTCGACCGIYNFNYTSRQNFFDRILDRTLKFEKIKRTMDAILEFGEAETKRIESLGDKPFPDFHHCPFAGFMDTLHYKPGCLLHPMSEKNNGVDFRGLSYYGGLACASYFCPTYYNVSPERKLMVRNAVEDSYTYGLVITEDEMINSIFDLIEKKRGKKIFPHEVNDESLIMLEKILKLKIEWPLRSCNRHPANYFFGDAETIRNDLDPEQSEVFNVLKAVKASFSDKKDILDAEKLINKSINDFVDLL